MNSSLQTDNASRLIMVQAPEAAQAREVWQTDKIASLHGEIRELQARLVEAEEAKRRAEAELARQAAPSAGMHMEEARLQHQLAALRQELRGTERAAQRQASQLREQLEAATRRLGRLNAWADDAALSSMLWRRDQVHGMIAFLQGTLTKTHVELNTLLNSAQWRIGGMPARLLGRGRNPMLAAELRARYEQFLRWRGSYERRRLAAMGDETEGTMTPLNKAAKAAAVAGIQREIAEARDDLELLVEFLDGFWKWAEIVQGTQRFRLGELVVCQLVKLKLRPWNAGYLRRLECLRSQYQQWLAANAPLDKITQHDMPRVPEV